MTSSKSRNERRLLKQRLAKGNGRRPDGTIDPVQVIQVHVVADETSVWAHTHGLEAFGLPELEVRDAPTYLATPAGTLLNAVADYLLNSGRAVRLGEGIRVDGYGTLTLEVAVPQERFADHYERVRWTVRSLPVDVMCECCQRQRIEEGHPLN
jgi:hypothetical protein